MGLTTDPTDECIRVLRADGQQECYLVLSEEERAKGFVRPVRMSYTHQKCMGSTRMGLALCETYARDPDFYGGTFCAPCGNHFPLFARLSERGPEHRGIADTEKGIPNFLWNEDQTPVGS